MSNAFYKNYFDTIYSTLKQVEVEKLEASIEMIDRTRRANGKVILVGNGGSAAMAAHVAVDFTKNAKVRGITFNEADLITCFANDFGHENWMAKAIEHYALPQDLVILISSSGQSKNIVNAAHQCAAMKLPLITLSGFSSNNPLRELGQVNLWAASSAYNIVEMTHHVWLLAICDRMIEQANQK